MKSGERRLTEDLRAVVGEGKQYYRMTTTPPHFDLIPSTEARPVLRETGVAIYLDQAGYAELCMTLSMNERTENTNNWWRDHFARIMYESRLRKEYPAVEAAWNEYQNLLAMVDPTR